MFDALCVAASSTAVEQIGIFNTWVNWIKTTHESKNTWEHKTFFYGTAVPEITRALLNRPSGSYDDEIEREAIAKFLEAALRLVGEMVSARPARYACCCVC
jgi:hypothetical protein